MKYKAAVILAAGRCPADLYAQTHVLHTADLRFGDRATVDRVVDAFRGAGFDHIFVVGTLVEGCHHIADQGSFIANLRAGLIAAEKFGTIFVSTCDIPFLTTEEVRGFMEAQRGSTLYCSVIPMQACREAFPELARTTITLADGEFTLGNVFAAEYWVWRNALPVVERAFAARKSKVRLAFLMGLPTAYRYARARKRPEKLSIDQLERRARKVIKTDVRAVIGNWPGIGTDVDSLAHYEAAQRYFCQPPIQQFV
jgi:hypothetical protein